MSDSRIELAEDWTEDPWVRFPRAFSRDAELSWRAKGVALLLAGHSSTFRFSAEELMKWAKDGRDGTRAGLKELEKAGYLVRERAVDENGRSSGMIYRLYTKPQVKPQTDLPSTVTPSPVEPSPVKASNPYKESTPKEYTYKEEHPSEEQTLTGEPVGDGPKPPFADDFSAWWATWPKKVGKGHAEKAYRAARKGGATAEELLAPVSAVVKQYEREPNRRQYIPHPATWLNGRRWEDEYDTTAPSDGPSGVTYRGEGWAADAEAERDENGLTAEDRWVQEQYGATVTYG